jgi:hypothetical protein
MCRIKTPFAELLASLNNPNIKEIGTPGQEDPSLVLLYSELRDWSVQTIRGSWAILPIRETQVSDNSLCFVKTALKQAVQFITHIAEAFCRMGKRNGRDHTSAPPRLITFYVSNRLSSAGIGPCMQVAIHISQIAVTCALPS